MKAKTLYGSIWNIFIALIFKIQSTEKNCLSRHKRSGDCVVQLTSAISLSCLRWSQLCQIMRILLQQLLEDNTVCPQLAQTPSEYSHPIRPPAAAWNVDTRRQNSRFRVALCQKILTQPSDRQSWNRTRQRSPNRLVASLSWQVRHPAWSCCCSPSATRYNGVTSGQMSPFCTSDIIVSETSPL